MEVFFFDIFVFNWSQAKNPLVHVPITGIVELFEINVKQIVSIFIWGGT